MAADDCWVRLFRLAIGVLAAFTVLFIGAAMSFARSPTAQPGQTPSEPRYHIAQAAADSADACKAASGITILADDPKTLDIIHRASTEAMKQLQRLLDLEHPAQVCGSILSGAEIDPSRHRALFRQFKSRLVVLGVLDTATVIIQTGSLTRWLGPAAFTVELSLALLSDNRADSVALSQSLYQYAVVSSGIAAFDAGDAPMARQLLSAASGVTGALGAWRAVLLDVVRSDDALPDDDQLLGSSDETREMQWAKQIGHSMRAIRSWRLNPDHSQLERFAGAVGTVPYHPDDQIEQHLQAIADQVQPALGAARADRTAVLYDDTKAQRPRFLSALILLTTQFDMAQDRKIGRIKSITCWPEIRASDLLATANALEDIFRQADNDGLVIIVRSLLLELDPADQGLTVAFGDLFPDDFYWLTALASHPNSVLPDALKSLFDERRIAIARQNVAILSERERFDLFHQILSTREDGPARFWQDP